MCRIAGIISFDVPIDKSLQKIGRAMRDSLAHGGPDDQGEFIDSDNGVILENRRLSIIDLSSHGHQPMSNQSQTIWITYNGEIYNYQQLKNDLTCLGAKFLNNTDTEVIINAYEYWGIQAFSKLIGMFAFALYDKRENFLYLVRDHAGIKPLYYSITDNKLIFASEIRAFKKFNPHWQENAQWPIYFLLFGHIPEPFTTLHNALMLPKSSYVQVDLRKKSYCIFSYSQLTFSANIKDWREACRQLKRLKHKVVNRHLLADAPLGIFLSGGIDSSLLALIAAQQKKNITTLSIVFDEAEYSEECYQKMVVDKICSAHKSYKVSACDFVHNLDDIFAAMDLPTVDGVNTYFISKCAKEAGLKAVISGLGGDELFGGYPSFSRIVFFAPWREHIGWRKLLSLLKYVKNDKLQKLSFLSLSDPVAYYLLFRGLYSIRNVVKILNVDEEQVVKLLYELPLSKNFPHSKKNFVSHLETNLYMQNQLLRDSDCMGMWHSIEIRVPFLDKELMELVFGISEKIKFANKVPKALLSNTFSDILPSEIIHRKKCGFTFPFALWLKNNIEIFREKTKSNRFDTKHIDLLWKKFNAGHLHWSRIWSLVVLGNNTNQ